MEKLFMSCRMLYDKRVSQETVKTVKMLLHKWHYHLFPSENSSYRFDMYDMWNNSILENATIGDIRRFLETKENIDRFSLEMGKRFGL